MKSKTPQKISKFLNWKQSLLFKLLLKTMFNAIKIIKYVLKYLYNAIVLIKFISLVLVKPSMLFKLLKNITLTALPKNVLLIR